MEYTREEGGENLILPAWGIDIGRWILAFVCGISGSGDLHGGTYYCMRDVKWEMVLFVP
jgi:hypothetical protein